MRILFETGHVIKDPSHNVGIPRVIRNVAVNLDQCESKDVEIIPVMSWNHVIYDVSEIVSNERCVAFVSKTYFSLEKLCKRISQSYEDVRSSIAFGNGGLSLKVLLKLSLLAKRIAYQCLKLFRHLRMRNIVKELPVIDIAPNDVVVWAGTWRNPKGKAFLEAAKAKGARIVIVVYDFFQINRPEIMPGNSEKVDVLPMMLLADGFLSISSSVNEEMKQILQEQRDSFADKQIWTDSFYLGADLDLVDSDQQPRDSIKNFFETKKPVYIMVSTISPHKNHEYAIDAFEHLWSEGKEIRLLLIGKIGWKCDAIVHRIKNHPQWKEHLFMVNDAPDTELAYCYKNAKSLVFPSLCEGFGLPLIEAMQYGLPVMASDIPVFREIGGDYVAYFDICNTAQLSDLIVEFESKDVFPARKSIDKWQWLSWEESTRGLVDKISWHESTIDSRQSSN